MGTLLVALATALVVGLIVWALMRSKAGTAYDHGKQATAVDIATLTEKSRAQEADIHRLEGRLAEIGAALQAQSEKLNVEAAAHAAAEARASRVGALEDQMRTKESEAAALREKNAELLTRIEAERKSTEEKMALLNEARQSLTDQFRNLANQIFEEKGARFTQQNQANLDALLKPLGERLQEFQKRVEETYDKESKQRFSLQSEIQKLLELNTKISEDAVNLANALKGQSKTQGTWGELILERVLESSGLQKGREYEVQVSLDRDDGGRAQPDVVVRLPENKHVVIDSKVSLTAYEAYCSADNDDDRARELARHIDSVRRHIAALSEKNYQALYGIRSLDFVLMFMPIEPAFMLAAQTDRDLFGDAFRRNIMIVGPSTLLISLKTIAGIWRYEYQNRNAQELARQCGALYDKFVGFVTDLEDIGKKIDAAHRSYDTAHGKLSTGKGNLVRQVERIRQLGVKPTKVLPPAMVEAALDGADEPEKQAPPVGDQEDD